MEDCNQFVEKYSSWPVSMFMANFPLPLLLIEKSVKKSSSSKSSKSSSFHTKKVTIESGESWKFGKGRALGIAPQHMACIFDFQRASDRLRMISLGRSSTNVISLKESTISKFHAYFRQDPSTDNWQLVDADSENGTMVNGVPIIAKQQIALSNGDGIVFGDTYFCTFFLPQGFYRYMASIS